MKTIRQAKWCYIICSALMTLFGIYVIILPGVSAVSLCFAVGIISVLCGITKILGYISHDLYNLAFQFDLSLGIFTLVFGMILLLRAEKVISFLPVVIGIFVLIDGVFKLQTALDAKRFGLSNWWLILLGSLLCTVLSLFLIIDPVGGGALLMSFVGIALTADGLQNLFNAFYTVKILKNLKEETYNDKIR